MTRAQETPDLAKELLPVALALARFLDLMCPADPNPSGHQVHRSEPKKGPRPVSDQAPALIAEQEYSVKEAAEITHRPEITLRKMLGDGRLPCRKENRRVMILGRDLARLMSKQQEGPGNSLAAGS
jgi:hypothetical protein